jgi:hypothetical protein
MDYPLWFPPALVTWLPVLGSLVVGVLTAMVIFHLGERVVRRAAREAPVAASVAACIRAPAKWVLPLLFINLVLQGAPEDAVWLSGIERLMALLLIAVRAYEDLSFAITHFQGQRQDLPLINCP